MLKKINSEWLRNFGSRLDKYKAQEDIVKEFTKILSHAGFPIAVRWKLDCSKGSSLSFYGRVNLDVYVAHITKFGERANSIHAWLSVYIVNSGNNVMNLNVIRLDTSNRMAKFINEFLVELEANIKQMSLSLERIGYSILEVLTIEQLAESGLAPQGGPELTLGWDTELLRSRPYVKD